MGSPGTERTGPRRVEPVQQTELGCRLEGVRRLDLTVDGWSFGVQASRSRAMPWVRILRLPRLGHGVPHELLRGAVRGLKVMADAGGVLRAHVEGWAPDPAILDLLSDACAAAGFVSAGHPRTYRDTIWMTLAGSEEEVLAGFHKTARANIRAPAKKGLEVRPITEARLAPKLRALHEAAFARTGGAPPGVDWAAVVRACAERPDKMRVAGLFPAGSDENGPLAFAVALCHGDVAEYAFAGSTRQEGMNVPLLYAPTWELMRWARGRGAHWWDFGGVTPPGSADPRAGISDFKLYFSRSLARVGAEWVYEPSPTLARVARGVSALRRRARGG